MALDAGKILKVVGNSLLVTAANLVISNGGKLRYLVLPPYGGLVSKYLPISIARADIGHIAGEQEHFGVFVGHALDQPFPNTRIGPDLHRRISETHVTITNHVHGGARLVFGDRERWVYIDFFLRLGRGG